MPDNIPQRARLDVSVLGPLGQMKDDICSLADSFDVERIVKLWVRCARIFRGLGVMNAHLGAIGLQGVSYRQRGRVSHIVSARLEGSSQHSHVAVGQLSAYQFAGQLNDARAPQSVDAIDLVEKSEGIADAQRGTLREQRMQVFRQAAATETETGRHAAMTDPAVETQSIG